MVRACLWEIGIGFLMAPRHHSATRHVAPTRVELGTRTIFNLLGPLSSPAGARRQLVGVFAPEWVRPMAEVLGRLGGERAWVVHGDGLDELTTAGPTTVAALADGPGRDLRDRRRGRRAARGAARRSARRRARAQRPADARVAGGRRRPAARRRAAEQRCSAAGRRQRGAISPTASSSLPARSIRAPRAGCSTIWSRAPICRPKLRGEYDERRARPHLRRQARRKSRARKAAVSEATLRRRPGRGTAGARVCRRRCSGKSPLGATA